MGAILSVGGKIILLGARFAAMAPKLVLAKRRAKQRFARELTQLGLPRTAVQALTERYTEAFSLNPLAYRRLR